jgi:Txe/YoeB family toxin of Txe-Axe toxin-antitoxin module
MPWLIHYFQRHVDDDPEESVPPREFIDGVDASVAAQIEAVLEAVAEAPPPSFSGGGFWEAMHGDMAGYYEVRVRHGGENHRLFCLLDRDAEDLGGSSIVCLGGLSKPVRSAAHPRDDRRIRRYGDEFRARRQVWQ